MDDKLIVQLYWERSENAITETDKKYGKYCYAIAYNILADHEDSMECVNDTYLNVWESIPPHRPQRLLPFLGKITRNISLNRYSFLHAEKRGGSQISLCLDELSNISNSAYGDSAIDDIALAEILNRFLSELSPENRKIFMRRYWYFSSVKEIAKDYGLTESKVKMSLMRTRSKLKQYLEKEGISL